MFVVHSWSLIIWSISKIQKNNGLSALFDVCNNRIFNNRLLYVVIYCLSDYTSPESNQTSRLDTKIDKYILLFLFFLFQSLKSCVNTVVWQSNYTLSNYDTFMHTHTESYRQHYWLFYSRLDIVKLLYLVYFRIKDKHLPVQNTTPLDSLNSSIIKRIICI